LALSDPVNMITVNFACYRSIQAGLINLYAVLRDLY